jgi:hypothetical protein
MFNNLGIQWAATLLGCLATLCVPIPVCFYLFGKKLRQKSKFAPTMAPPKKQDEEDAAGTSEEEEAHEDDNQHGMSALHATRSVAHHHMEQRWRTRTRTISDAQRGGAAGVVQSNGNNGGETNVSEKQE